MPADLSERLFAAYYPLLARRSDRAGQARTRERLPVLPVLVRTVDERRSLVGSASP